QRREADEPSGEIEAREDGMDLLGADHRDRDDRRPGLDRDARERRAPERRQAVAIAEALRDATLGMDDNGLVAPERAPEPGDAAAEGPSADERASDERRPHEPLVDERPGVPPRRVMMRERRLDHQRLVRNERATAMRDD